MGSRGSAGRGPADRPRDSSKAASVDHAHAGLGRGGLGGVFAGQGRELQLAEERVGGGLVRIAQAQRLGIEADRSVEA
jgi:hypothetical protein